MEVTMTPTISVRECVRFGWKTLIGNPLPFVTAVAVIDGLMFLSEYLGPSVSVQNPVSIVWFVFLILVMVIVQVTIMTSFMLRAHDHPETVSLRDVFSVSNGWKLAGTTFLSLLAVAIGLILLIVPGIIVALVLAFSGYLAIEGRSPVAAMKESARLTKGNRIKLFLIGLLMLGSLVLSLLFLPFGDTASRIAEFVADLVVLPVMGIAFAHAYRQLQQAKAVETTNV